MTSHNDENEFSFKDLLLPFTNLKAYILIILIGSVVYFNSIINYFNSDDFPQIINNIPIHSITNILSFFIGSTFYNGGNQHINGVYYKPILSSFFSLIYTFFGANYIIFHTFQVSLHIINSCAVFYIFKYFVKKPVAFILSLIFLLHPINSEAVFYISATQEPLFFFFGILALIIFIKENSRKSLIFVSLLLFLSLLSKETGILFVVMTNIYSFIFKRKSFYLLLVYSIAMILIYFSLRINAVGIFTNSYVSPIDKLNLFERTLYIPSTVYFYLKTFIFPLNLAFSYQWFYKTIDFWNFFFPLICDGIFVGVLFFVGRDISKNNHNNFKIYIFFILWLIIGIIMHVQLIPLDATVAERWFYFPIVGILGILGVLLEKTINFRWVVALLVAMLIILSVRTVVRSFDWRDEFTLVSHDINVSKDYVIENELSFELSQQEEYEEAKKHALSSIELFPTYSNYINLGVADFHLGNLQESKKAYLHALKFGDNYIVYEDLAGLAIVSEDSSENIKFVRKSVKKYPQDAKLWLFLAILEYRSKNVTEAKKAIERAYSYNNSDSLTNSVYNSIMNNQPLMLNF